ncbi:MAG: CHAP domain-containing protein [Pseudolysinimonas sp.]
MTTFSGADVAEVRALGGRMRSQSAKLRDIANSSNLALMMAEWTGNDIDAVRNNWRRSSLPTITRLADLLHDMSVDLERQAAEQERVSGGSTGTSPGSWGDGIRLILENWFGKFVLPLIPGHNESPSTPEPHSPVQPQHPDLTLPPHDPSAPQVPGSSTPGTLPGWNEAEYRKFESENLRPIYNKDGTLAYYADQNGKAVDNCTAWAAWRWEQLHPGRQAPWGDGGQMAAALHGTPQTAPTLGALASYSEGSYGHVMVVEELRPDGTLRVSETNYANSSAIKTDRVWTPVGNGVWQCGNMKREISFSAA